ncbi:MAG: hypothetical protein WAU32_07905 [Thermoanaerobaculia bacterium]
MSLTLAGSPAAALLTALALSCAATQVSPAERTGAALTGNWGGDGAGLQATEAGARMEFDCASGSIDGAITLDKEGRFDAAGTYAREGPGPTRPDQVRGAPVRYEGKVVGDALTLSVRLSGSHETLGPFTLTRGRLARVRACG